MKPIYMAYCTADHTYLAAAGMLKQSLERFSLDYRIIYGPRAENWHEACRVVPREAYKAYMEEARSVVWLDADCTIERDPVLFDDMVADLAIHWVSCRNRWRTGTMFFNRTPGGQEAMQRWADVMDQSPANWSGMTAMRQVIGTMDKLNIHQLPAEYCNIPDIDKCTEPVITHHQASRIIMKHKCNQRGLL